MFSDTIGNPRQLTDDERKQAMIAEAMNGDSALNNLINGDEELRDKVLTSDQVEILKIADSILVRLLKALQQR